MFKRIVIASFFASLLFGCGKKVVSTSSPDKPAQSSQTPSNNKKPSERSDKDKDKKDAEKKGAEKANWFTDPRFQPEKSEPEEKGLPGKPGLGLYAPKPDLSSPPQLPPSNTTPPGKKPVPMNPMN